MSGKWIYMATYWAHHTNFKFLDSWRAWKPQLTTLTEISNLTHWHTHFSVMSLSQELFCTMILTHFGVRTSGLMLEHVHALPWIRSFPRLFFYTQYIDHSWNLVQHTAELSVQQSEQPAIRCMVCETITSGFTAMNDWPLCTDCFNVLYQTLALA